MKKRNLKNSDGFVASDAIMAIIIITIFTAIIATLAYNIYLSNSSLKRMSKANNYIIDIFEYVDKLYYEEVTEEKLITYLNEKYNSSGVKAVNDENTDVETPFKIIIKVQKYNELEGNEGKLDLLKEVTATVQYKLGNKKQSITMRKNKNREKIVTPNKPDLSLINLNAGEKIYPVKQKNSEYIVCDENDATWYNYNENIYATIAITSNNLKIGDKIEDTYTKYKWIPRYAVNPEDETDIKYLFSNTNDYLEEQNGYEKLVDIGTKYVVKSDFQNEDIGIWEKI